MVWQEGQRKVLPRTGDEESRNLRVITLLSTVGSAMKPPQFSVG